MANEIKRAVGISQIRKPLRGSFIRFGLGVDNKLCTNRIQRHNFRNDRFYFRGTINQIRCDGVASSLCCGLRQPVPALLITQADGEAIRRRERGAAKLGPPEDQADREESAAPNKSPSLSQNSRRTPWQSTYFPVAGSIAVRHTTRAGSSRFIRDRGRSGSSNRCNFCGIQRPKRSLRRD